MRKTKFVVALLLILVLAVTALSGCGAKEKDSSGDANTGGKEEKIVLKVGATPVPHAEILNEVKDDLAAEGITLEVIEFQDYVQPNLSLADGELDANFFQHIQYLESFNKDHNLNLVSAGGIHSEPMGIYSNLLKDLTELKNNAQVAIPNDPSNGRRALLLLQEAGLIKVDTSQEEATTRNITENPKNLKIVEMEAAMLPKVLDDVEIAVINTNYALDAGFNPMEDSLFMEGKDSPYVNIITVRSGDENKPAIQKLVKALTSEAMRTFILQKYEGAVVPDF